MEDDWEGHPLRKDYPLGGEPVRFSGGRSSSGRHRATGQRSTRARGSRRRSRPSSRSTADLRDADDILQVNFGPNHPSTHGVLRLVVELNGEKVVGLRAVIGYLHTGFEKNMEHKTWWKAITYPERIDYVSFQNNELVFVLAIEKLLEIEPPPKAQWMRMLLCELNRIHSHLVWLGTAALELGAISMFWYCFRERDPILDLFEMVTGSRMHTRYFQAGGLAEDIPVGFYDECRAVRRQDAEARSTSTSRSSRATRSGSSGRRASASSRPTDAIALGQSGPVLRASGVDWDLRRDEPYLAYDEVDFDVPVYPNGDVYDRYKVRMDEMRQSTRIVQQCLDGHARGAVDRGRPQDRAAAAPRAAHLDGEPDPPLQARHRGLPGARGRGLRHGRVAARRARLLPRLRRRPQARGA